MENTNETPQVTPVPKKRGRPAKQKLIAPNKVEVEKDPLLLLVQARFLDWVGFEPNSNQCKAFLLKLVQEL